MQDFGKCRRCHRVLKNPKRRSLGIGASCERQEKNALLEEIRENGYDGVPQKHGVQMLLRIGGE